MSIQFATVSDGSIVALGDATSPHPLKNNQFFLTEQEYMVLMAVRREDDWEEALLRIIESIEEKRMATVRKIHDEQS